MAKKTPLVDLLQKSPTSPQPLQKKDSFSERVTAERQVRLNINIPESLLKRIRIKAAEEGTSMTKLLMPLLEKEFIE